MRSEPHTMDVTDLYRTAADAFAGRVRLIGGRWDAPTPCAGWDVRALVHHIVEEDLWTPPLYAGRTVDDVGDSFAGDLLGPDPLAAFTVAARDAAAAVAGSGAMERTVHLSFGDVPGTEYAMQLAADHLVHAWDLGRALGADPDLDPAAVGAVRAWFEGTEDAYRQAGMIGPRGTVPDGAGPLRELLAMFGRQP
ncbi:TIGR03086 family metal-binding protein [Dactylosporangium sp. NBC_01737]|uniref:TIGR03086 family metal-binding protein n=1 Tax=Dactylosporangium sp. NBC_01737 TaxID=2975959 RepID=UPI002E0FADFD|nr:TIGR03086 family metal-binding protein [Dactylosporangium sp. NBC_01737]